MVQKATFALAPPLNVHQDGDIDIDREGEKEGDKGLREGLLRSIVRVDEYVVFPAAILWLLVVLREDVRKLDATFPIRVWLGRPPPCLHGCRGCLECCTKSTPTIAVDEPSRGLKIQGRTVKKPNVTEEFWSTSTLDLENSGVQSQRSVSSISTLAPASFDHHGIGSTSNSLEFVNHGLVLWHQTRQQWIGDTRPAAQRQRAQDPRLRWNATYDNLLGSNKPFPRPIPLSEMIHFLVDEWDQEGLYD